MRVHISNGIHKVVYNIHPIISDTARTYAGADLNGTCIVS